MPTKGKKRRVSWVQEPLLWLGLLVGLVAGIAIGRAGCGFTAGDPSVEDASGTRQTIETEFQAPR